MKVPKFEGRVLKNLVEAIKEDPVAFGQEVLEGVFETDLLATAPLQWAGKVGCQIALALLTGGGALATKLGGATKLLAKINKFLDSKPGSGKLDPILPDRNTRGNDRDTDRRDDDGRDDDDEGAPKCLTRNSFPSETPVRMANGSLLAIERIQPGDRVLAADPIHGNWSSQLVLDQWSHIDNGKMATVILADGSRVTATDHHQFWVASDGAWLELEDVDAGDLLLTPSGITRVAAVAVHPEAQTLVWELDTTGPNTFTVHTGTSDVLVHNECFPLDKSNRQSRSLTDTELNHTFDRHGWELLNIPQHALSRDLHFDAVKDIINRAKQSNLTFRSRSGASETIAHLARIDGEYVVVHFFADGPDAGSLASAWRPTGQQLTGYLEQASRQGP